MLVHGRRKEVLDISPLRHSTARPCTKLSMFLGLSAPAAFLQFVSEIREVLQVRGTPDSPRVRPHRANIHAILDARILRCLPTFSSLSPLSGCPSPFCCRQTPLSCISDLSTSMSNVAALYLFTRACSSRSNGTSFSYPCTGGPPTLTPEMCSVIIRVESI